MLNLMNKAEKEVYYELISHVHTAKGTNFALAMRQEDGSIQVHRRENQPCQGGEMRKYESSHPGDCTRPLDRRPSDLRYPFPKGTPEAVSVRFSYMQPTEFVEALLSSVSPYKLLDGEYQKITKERFDRNYWTHGLVLLNTDVDSTLLVNLLQLLNHQQAGLNFLNLKEVGATDQEALTIILAGLSSFDPTKMFGQQNSYYFPVNAAIHRIWNGTPHDLTGGTFRDRFDYNRPQIQDLFAAKLVKQVAPTASSVNGSVWSPPVQKFEETATNFCALLNAATVPETVSLGEGQYVWSFQRTVIKSWADVLEKSREIVNEALKKEEERVK